MRRIIFLCPADDTPTGGIKVIYRHCELLNRLGVNAFVMHPFDQGFRCSWFAHNARFTDSPQLDPAHDFVIVPELWALPFGQQCREAGLRYGIFVQNGYLTHAVLPAHSRADVQAAYQGAALILSISADSSRMVRTNYPGIRPERIVPVRYSIGPQFHTAANAGGGGSRARRISYMPRKLADHASRVMYALHAHLPPGWQLLPIHQASEADCARLLFSSSIFMSFSSFEGLPLPPLEAAVAGNMVIGYTGEGAKEYWHKPQFQEIQPGDIVGFSSAVVRAARQLDSGAMNLASLRASSLALAQRFSETAELAALGTLHARIEGLFGTSVGRLAVRELEPA